LESGQSRNASWARRTATCRCSRRYASSDSARADSSGGSAAPCRRISSPPSRRTRTGALASAREPGAAAVPAGRVTSPADAEDTVDRDVAEPGRPAVRVADDERSNAGCRAQPEGKPRILRGQVAGARLHLAREPAAVGQDGGDDGAGVEPLQ